MSLALLYTNRGGTYQSCGNLNQAEEDFIEAIRIAKNASLSIGFYLQNRLARFYIRSEQFDLAKKCNNAALADARDGSVLDSQLGDLLFTRAVILAFLDSNDVANTLADAESLTGISFQLKGDAFQGCLGGSSKVPWRVMRALFPWWAGRTPVDCTQTKEQILQSHHAAQGLI